MDGKNRNDLFELLTVISAFLRPDVSRKNVNRLLGRIFLNVVGAGLQRVGFRRSKDAEIPWNVLRKRFCSAGDRRSAAQWDLLQIVECLLEGVLIGITGSHSNPDAAHGDMDLGADLQYL